MSDIFHSFDCGFVFATTGDLYTTLARRTARNLRQTNPDVLIDLYTDQQVEDEVFDQIHQLTHKGRRPKMEALRRSRFEKTFYLDADVVVLEDIREVFAVFDFSDIVGCQGFSRTKGHLKTQGIDIPRCFPLINGGVLGIRKTKQMDCFLQEWEDRWENADTLIINLDQPILRGLLFEKRILPLVLPREYNLIKLNELNVWRDVSGGLRILHARKLHSKEHSNPHEPVKLSEILSPEQVRIVNRARKLDWTIDAYLENV